MTSTPPTLEDGRVYGWDELASIFGFKANYLGTAGGMISRPEFGALLLMTSPGGEETFYGDEWEDEDLLYAGRGKTGNQKLNGQNRDVAENAKKLFVFQAAGSRRLEFLGSPTCVDHFWTDRADSEGTLRKVIRFRLRFDSKVTQLDAYRASEGAKRRVLHARIERDAGLVARAKRTWRERDARLPCEVCGFSFHETYGALGEECSWPSRATRKSACS